MCTALPGVEQGLLANLHNYVQINAGQLGRIAERCKRIVPIAVDRAIVELINPIVEKSVTTACMTTQELVSKVRPLADTDSKSDCLIRKQLRQGNIVNDQQGKRRQSSHRMQIRKPVL